MNIYIFIILWPFCVNQVKRIFRYNSSSFSLKKQNSLFWNSSYQNHEMILVFWIVLCLLLVVGNKNIISVAIKTIISCSKIEVTCLLLNDHFLYLDGIRRINVPLHFLSENMIFSTINLYMNKIMLSWILNWMHPL